MKAYSNERLHEGFLGGFLAVLKGLLGATGGLPEGC